MIFFSFFFVYKSVCTWYYAFWERRKHNYIIIIFSSGNDSSHYERVGVSLLPPNSPVTRHVGVKTDYYDWNWLLRLAFMNSSNITGAGLFFRPDDLENPLVLIKPQRFPSQCRPCCLYPRYYVLTYKTVIDRYDFLGVLPPPNRPVSRGYNDRFINQVIEICVYFI